MGRASGAFGIRGRLSTSGCRRPGGSLQPEPDRNRDLRSADQPVASGRRSGQCSAQVELHGFASRTRSPTFLRFSLLNGSNCMSVRVSSPSASSSSSSSASTWCWKGFSPIGSSMLGRSISRNPSMQSSQNILSGVRVVELATVVFVPSTGTVMSDFGAEVIKIEPPGGGDIYRRFHELPGMPDSEISLENSCMIEAQLCGATFHARRPARRGHQLHQLSTTGRGTAASSSSASSTSRRTGCRSAMPSAGRRSPPIRGSPSSRTGWSTCAS